MTSVTPPPEVPDETAEEAKKRKARERARAWRAANPEHVKERERARYLKDREKRLAYEADPERRRKKAERMKAARARDPELARIKFQAWNYSLTVDRVRELLASGCDACGSTTKLHIDHDHACCPTGRSPRSCGKCVRGALCHGCNTALGLLGESEKRILALLAHVRKREAP